VSVPTEELPPAIPFTSQASVDPAGTHSEAVNVCDAPSSTLAEVGEIESVAAHVTVTVALPDFVPSAALVAVTVTVAGEGGAFGAVYSAVVALVAAIVPTVGFPPAIPFTLQFSPALGSPLAVTVTVAVNTCSPPVGTLAGFGATVIEMLSSSVTPADPLSAVFAALTAVTVIPPSAGIATGAVYNPNAETVPVLVPPPTTPFTSHVTAVFELPLTLA
jgi:hypothetical protein